MKLSLISKLSLGVAASIMLVFFSYQLALLIGYADLNYNSVVIGFASILLFTPFFFIVVVEFVRKARYKFQ